MGLNIIGIGLGDEKDVTVRGLELIRKSSKVYLESYTSVLQCSIEKMEELYGKKVIPAYREKIERQAEQILEEAKTEEVSLLIIGDVFSATTHADFVQRAKEKEVEVNVVHNASILSAIGATGLQVYKFGKITSIPFENEKVDTPYNYLEENQQIGAHTLFLLDLRPDEDRFLRTWCLC